MALTPRQEANQHIASADRGPAGRAGDPQQGTLQLRMVPIGETFSRFRRVVRDTAAELGKDVVLEIEGGDTELDKSVVERIADPLMHLVRNALDHGLETPAQRMAAGKPAQGRLVLSACHESGSILIRIIDDGRGIDRDKVLQARMGARPGRAGRGAAGCGHPQPDFRARVFHRRQGDQPQRARRGHGRSAPQHRGAARLGHVSPASRPGLAHRHPAAPDAGHHRRLPGRRRAVQIHLPAGCGGRGHRGPRHCRRCPRTPAGAIAWSCAARLLPVVEPAHPVRPGFAGPRAQQHRRGAARPSATASWWMRCWASTRPSSSRWAGMLRSLRGISGSSILGSGEVALIFDVASLNHLAAQPSHPVTHTPAGPLSKPASVSINPRTELFSEDHHERKKTSWIAQVLIGNELRQAEEEARKNEQARTEAEVALARCCRAGWRAGGRTEGAHRHHERHQHRVRGGQEG
jgi:two-component system chemotaxis sensor kinase CheA